MKDISIGAIRDDMVNPGSSVHDVLQDASMMLETVVEQIRSLACEVATEGGTTSNAAAIFGTLYLAEISKALIGAAQVKENQERARS